jgi:hypothetical protein
MHDRTHLTWRQLNGAWALHCQGRRRAVLCVEPDVTYPGMWRIRRSDGSLSDMANLTWARDGAMSLALSMLNPTQRAAA